MKQYFYLVCSKFNDNVHPEKIFLQEHHAIRYGRIKAAMNRDLRYYLYRQAILTTAEIEFVKEFSPFELEVCKNT